MYEHSGRSIGTQGAGGDVSHRGTESTEKSTEGSMCIRGFCRFTQIERVWCLLHADGDEVRKNVCQNDLHPLARMVSFFSDKEVPCWPIESRLIRVCAGASRL